MYGDALTTIDRIKDRLQITVTSFDTVFTNLILATTARIERMCNRSFIQATYSNETYDGSDAYGTQRRIIIVKNAPIQTLSSIEYKQGLNSTPNWTAFNVDDYEYDATAGIVEFYCPLPRGRQNIRITYTGGFSGYSIGVNNFWFFNITPDGAVDGVNRAYTLPEAASQVIVYADGLRIAAANYSFTPGDDAFTFNSGQQPQSTIAVDYLRLTESSGSDLSLPLDLVEVCEEAVVRIFKRRDSEGRASETFDQSSITWNANNFTDENLAVIRSYRRATFL